MVLEDVDKMSPDKFSDVPPSQEDPYASSRSPSRSSGPRFDPSEFARPVPIIGRFMGFSEAAVRFKTNTTIDFAERKVGRALEPEEAQALASHIYKLEQSKSYFAAFGGTMGAFRWYSTDMQQYPFYRTKVEPDPTKFSFVRGIWANTARQTWRFSLYVLVAGQMGSIIGQVISQPLAAAATAQDPKLEQFGSELKASSSDDQRKNAERARMIEERRKQFEERRAKEKTGGTLPPYSGWGSQDRKQHSTDDDMSPTSGNESWGDFTSDAPQSPPQQQQQQQSSSAAYTQPRRSSPYQSSQSPLLFDDDDASPTGGMFQDEVRNAPTSATAQPQGRPGESSWERLRRGGAPPVQPVRPTETGRRGMPERREGSASGSTIGDDFTFTEGREERQREKERAQREFDERLERERQGRDFSGDEGKRW